MRMKARESGLSVPDFVRILNYDLVRQFMERVPAPWVLKPRSMAGSIGIRKIHHSDELWPMLESLGDLQSHYLLERFVPGDIFHVDTIVCETEVLFAIASGYGRPPMEVSHQGAYLSLASWTAAQRTPTGLMEILRIARPSPSGTVPACSFRSPVKSIRIRLLTPIPKSSGG